jgi:hypothetical protein
VYGIPGSAPGGVQGSRPGISPTMMQNWFRLRAYKSLSIGATQGALAGMVPGALVGFANWLSGGALSWVILFMLGGALGGLLRGWAPGHRLASLISRFIGWKLFWEAIGLIAGAVGGVALGMVLAVAVVPVILGLFVGAQAGMYLGRKLYQLGDLLGWERIWGGLSAAGFGLLGLVMTQLLGAVGLNILGLGSDAQLLPSAATSTMLAGFTWLLVGGLVSGLGGALAGLVADVIGRFTGLVD